MGADWGENGQEKSRILGFISVLRWFPLRGRPGGEASEKQGKTFFTCGMPACEDGAQE
jgi:hypothetical protein